MSNASTSCFGLTLIIAIVCSVLGLSVTCFADSSGFLYSGGTFTLIGPNHTDSAAEGINDVGQIVGFSSHGGFLYSDGVYTTINDPRAFATQAFGINSSGQISGTYYLSHPLGGDRGFLLDHGTFHPINVPGADRTDAVGINNDGQIAGDYFATRDSQSQGFLYSAGTYTTIDVPGATATVAIGINDSGQIVGFYIGGSCGLALRICGFILSGENFVTIEYPGASGTTARGINDLGQIVGGYNDSKGIQHGYLLSDGVFTTIDFPGQTGPPNTVLTDINDRSDIVGTKGNFSGFVPEPTTLLTLGSGLAVVGVSLFRRLARSHASQEPR